MSPPKRLKPLHSSSSQYNISRCSYGASKILLREETHLTDALLAFSQCLLPVKKKDVIAETPGHLKP